MCVCTYVYRDKRKALAAAVSKFAHSSIKADVQKSVASRIKLFYFCRRGPLSRDTRTHFSLFPSGTEKLDAAVRSKFVSDGKSFISFGPFPTRHKKTPHFDTLNLKARFFGKSVEKSLIERSHNQLVLGAQHHVDDGVFVPLCAARHVVAQLSSSPWDGQCVVAIPGKEGTRRGSFARDAIEKKVRL